MEHKVALYDAFEQAGLRDQYEMKLQRGAQKMTVIAASQLVNFPEVVTPDTPATP